MILPFRPWSLSVALTVTMAAPFAEELWNWTFYSIIQRYYNNLTSKSIDSESWIKSTVGARIPNIIMSNLFKIWTFCFSDFEWFCNQMISTSNHSKTEPNGKNFVNHSKTERHTKSKHVHQNKLYTLHFMCNPLMYNYAQLQF